MPTAPFIHISDRDFSGQTSVQSNWKVKDNKLQSNYKLFFGVYSTNDLRIRANRAKMLEAYVETSFASIPVFEYKKGFFPNKKFQSTGNKIAIGMRYASSHLLENPIFNGSGKIELQITDFKL